MEVWEVVSILGMWRPEDDVLQEAPAAGKPVNDLALIKARYAAAARGEEEPVHLFGGSGFQFPPSPHLE